ncbi:hypothetical protein [Deinococcus sp. Marseille-Q6407]|uniref:hypothetical protein n=1 Tax=Deinococcus sp. Marseille-Q6407 TaxID=2969223 RepID=UPI0021C20610|nr:hypothetical protein [Deinococcus sp. Marseille-Q6407]
MRVFLSFVETHLYLHVTYEELLMRRTGHPAAVQGRAAHQRLAAYGEGLRARLLSQGPTQPLLEELHHVMCTWLLGHVPRVDLGVPLAATPAPAPGPAADTATPLPRLPQAG